MPRWSCCAVILVTSLWLTVPAVASEYFVDFAATPGVGCSDAGSGSDPRTGGTPWCTLPGTRVTAYHPSFLPGPWTRIHAGDTIWIKAGTTHTTADGAGAVLIDHTYYDDGTAAARIVIAKHPSWGAGPYASFDGTGITASQTGIVNAYGVDYLTLQDLEVFASPAFGIGIERDAHHAIIDRVFVHDGLGSVLVFLGGCTTKPCMQIVRNSVIANAEFGGGILIHDNPGGHVLIENNVVHDICGGAANLDGIQCGAYGGRTDFCAIRNNVVYAHGLRSQYRNCAAPGSDPISVGGFCHYNALVDGNEMYHSTGRLLVHGPYEHYCADEDALDGYGIVRRNRMTNINVVSYAYPNDTIFYNNTLYNPERPNVFQIYSTEVEEAPGTSFGTHAHRERVVEIGRDTDFGRLTIKNNILWGQPRYHVLLNGILGFRVDARWSSFRFSYNLYSRFVPLYWYPDDVGGFAYYPTAAAYLASRSSDPPDVGSIFSNASHTQVFVDAPQRDFRLVPGSPAIDAGTAITHAVGASEGGAAGSTTLRVERASFVDGYGGLFEPDHLTIGDCPDVAIVDLDDFAATILLARPCRWNDGDPVNLAFQGTTPDLGAFEIAPLPTPVATPTATPTSAPATCGDGVRAGAEQCDDGNRADGDCCSAGCTLAAAESTCTSDENVCTDDHCDTGGSCVHIANTAPCDDANACTLGDVCQGGACLPGVPRACNACEACDPERGCAVALQPACRQSTTPAASVLQFDAGRSTALRWVWAKGEATTIDALGDPLTGGRYTLCVFDESGAEPTVAFRARTRTGQCGAKTCWKRENASSFRYKDFERTPDGLDTLFLKSGDAGNAKVIVTGKGANLALPALPLALPVRVQLQADDGTCWESEHATVSVLKNARARFRARATTR